MMLCFVIPDPESFPSGGNIYNANLIKGLQDIGVGVITVFEVDPNSLEDPNALCFIDTLFIEKIKENSTLENSCLIVHHLASMDFNGEEKRQTQEKEKKSLERFQGFLSTSAFTTSYLRNTFGLTQPILTIPPALSVKKIEKNSRPVDAQKVLLVANIIERKGILEFLKEWSKYTWSDSFSLEIIGSPSLEPGYAKVCHDFHQQLPLNQKKKIHFLGSKNQEEVFLKYQDSNLLISASKMETFGMAIQEAMAFGLPVFVLKGGNSENHLQEKKNGKSFDQLRDLVADLKTWSDDPKVRENMLSNQTPANTYTWKNAATDFIQQLKTHYPNV